MKIIELRAENVKNLKVIEIKAGDVNILEGKNGAGKSSILDSIFMALTGGKVERPIREGQEKGNIVVDLGDYIVKKIFTSTGERLEVLSPEGAKYPSPQTMLNKILGKLAFDPLSFSKMEKNAQRGLLKQLVGLDFSALDTKRNNLYNERLFKGRELNNLEGTLSSLKEYSDIPENEISLNEEIAKVESLEKEQDLCSKIINQKESFSKEIDDNNIEIEHQRKLYSTQIENNEEKIKELNKQVMALQKVTGILIVELQEKIQTSERANHNLKNLADSLIIPDDKTEIINQAKENLKTVEETNVKIRENKKFKIVQEKINEKQLESKNLKTEIEKIDEEKVEKIKSCKFPIYGLGIDDETVLYNGRPFSMLSTGEQLKISTAIAMTLNPTLKIIILREGSLLDKDGLQLIIDMAKEKDYQLWIEKLGDEKTVGIYIEDGKIVK